MAKIEPFEDLQNWQERRQLANQIYNLASETKRLLRGMIAYLRKSNT